jgi:hypothetical protein
VKVEGMERPFTKILLNTLVTKNKQSKNGAERGERVI